MESYTTTGYKIRCDQTVALASRLGRRRITAMGTRLLTTIYENSRMGEGTEARPTGLFSS
jgi:hypothetical protein